MGTSSSKTIPETTAKRINKRRQKQSPLTEKIELKVATFDYGICLSPFQYESAFSGGEGKAQLHSLEKIFKQQFLEQMKIPFDKDFRWKIGSLDRHLKKLRYSPLYDGNIGVIDGKFFMSFQQFSAIWKVRLEKLVQALKYPIHTENYQLYKQNLLMMDWIFFRTFVRYAYHPLDGSTYKFQQICNKQLPHKYLIYMANKFQSKIINEGYKIEKLLKKLDESKVDILFLQEINDKIISKISVKSQTYRIASSKNISSAILISWDAYYLICGKHENYPLWSYNSIHIHPKESLLPQALGKSKYRREGKETRYYQQKMYSLKNSETSSPIAKLVKNIKQSEEDNPENEKKQFQAIDLHKIQQTQDKGDQTEEKQLFSSFRIKLQKQMETKPEKQQKMVEQQSMSSSSMEQRWESEESSCPTVQAKPYEKLMAMTFHQVLKTQNLINRSTQKIMRKIDFDNHYLPLSLIKQLDWDGDTFVQFLNEFILISGTVGNNNSHLQDKVIQRNQIQEMRSAIEELRKQLPSYTIIIGADVDVKWDQLQGYHMTPSVNKSEEIMSPTVFQKKTILQPQLKYAWQEFRASGDYIISSVPLSNQSITDIEDKNVENNPYLIPTEEHPYDHFLVTGTITHHKRTN